MKGEVYRCVQLLLRLEVEGTSSGMHPLNPQYLTLIYIAATKIAAAWSAHGLPV